MKRTGETSNGNGQKKIFKRQVTGERERVLCRIKKAETQKKKQLRGRQGINNPKLGGLESTVLPRGKMLVGGRTTKKKGQRRQAKARQTKKRGTKGGEA